MRRPVILALTLPLVLTLAACNGGPNLELPGFGRRTTDEAAIAALLDNVHLAMETKKLNRVMAHVSPDYMDLEGRDHDAIREYLRGLMKDYQTITIQRSAPGIVVEGDRARAVEAFGTQADSNSADIAPLNLQGQVSVYLARESDGWKIVEWGTIR